jgi:peroxiredoxin
MTQPFTPPQRPAILGPGTQAPDFALHATPDQVLRLSEMRGRPLILVFYPADWSPVCGDQVALYNEMLSEFREYNAEILGISVDGVWCHAAFARDRHLHFPLLADFEPKGAVARQYGAYREQEGTSERALFVLDGEGIIRWSYCSPIAVNPGADGILNALESISTATSATTESRRVDAPETRV